MYKYNLIILFSIVLFLTKSIMCHHFSGEPYVFDHGTVETYPSKYENDGFPKSDKIGSTKYFRPLLKPTMETPNWNFVKPTSPTAEKINLMKTYFDPVTKQPYRYVMRKKTEFDDGDSILNTASKILNKLIGTDGTDITNKENNFHETRSYMDFSMPLKHIQKREVSTKDSGTGNELERETIWMPIQMTVKSGSSIVQTQVNNLNGNRPDNTTNTIDRINLDQTILSEQLKRMFGNKSLTEEKLAQDSPVTEINENNSQEERSNKSTVGVEYFERYNEKKEILGIGNDPKVDLFDTENSNFGLMGSMKIVQKLFMNCKKKTKDGNKNFILSMQSCIQVSVLRALDRILSSQVIPLNEEISLVRDETYRLIKNSSQMWNPSAKDLKGNSDFIAAVCERMFRMLQSHSLQIKLWQSPDDVVEGRRRHHYRKAFPMMVAGYMMLSAFLVPLGFQFMAMIGGKALLLSKMALMMSMLGGFRKLLQPEYHGLPSYDLHGSGWHHRSTHEPMTIAYTKNNNGGYNNIQRNTQHWIDPKSYTVLK